MDEIVAALTAQMEDEKAQSLPSSMQREKGRIWLEGWFDLRAALAASPDGKDA